VDIKTLVYAAALGAAVYFVVAYSGSLMKGDFTTIQNDTNIGANLMSGAVVGVGVQIGMRMLGAS